MTSIPPTRPTLLFRIRDARDRSNSQHPVGNDQGGVAVDLDNGLADFGSLHRYQLPNTY